MFSEYILSLELGIIYGIAALGVFIAYKIVDFADLTVDASFALGAITSVILLQNNFNALSALGFSLVAGVLSGIFTALLYNYFNIPKLLCGVITSFMLYSVNLRIMNDKSHISLYNEYSIFDWGNSYLVLFCLLFLVISFVAYILLSDLGLALRSAGQNPKMARSYGVNCSFMVLWALALSNGLVALSGAIFAQHQRFADSSLGVGTMVIGLAAIILGEKILNKHSILVKLFACILGSALFRLIIMFALKSNFAFIKSSDLNFIIGLIIILVMAINYRKNYA
jgi:putative tryptophan/tyrosine transport system permease protein